MKSVVFMGTPEFAVPSLESLIKSDDYDVIAVVTQPDKPVGRKHILTASPVKQTALKYNLPVLQPDKISNSSEMQQIIDMQPDLIITAAFGQFLPDKLLQAVKIAAINIHASLLPKYRGGAPIHYAVMNGDDKTGISIIYMVHKMDAGKIIAQKSISITPEDDTGTMFEKLSILGKDLLLETLPNLINGNITPVEQDESQVIFSPNITRDQEKIDFNKTAQEIDYQVRGLRPFPGAYVVLNHQKTKLWDVQPLLDVSTDQKPGFIVNLTKHTLDVAAGKGTVLRINQLQPSGKSKLRITDYINGNKFSIGDKLVDIDE